MKFFQDVTQVKFTGLDHIFNVSSVFCEFSLPFLKNPVTIRWYGVIIAFGLTLAVLFGGRMAYKWKIDIYKMIDILIYGTLAGVIGAALAWLLVQSRRREIAVMRALGTQPGRIVGNFLLEQLLLMAVGLGIGVAVCRLTGAVLNPSQLLLTAVFLVLWSLSALTCLIIGLRKKSFAALTEPE